MMEDDGKKVLCGANAYTKKYYFNEAFSLLPQDVRDELQIMCVLFTEEIGGILTLWYDEEGTLHFETRAKENDLSYDEIGSRLKIRKLQKEKADLLQSLELFYRTFCL